MRFWGQTTEGIKSGKQATLAFRPEKTTLNNDESEARNRVGGRIQEVVYTGSATTYIVQLANGKTIVSKEQNLDATLDFKYQVGSQVTVTWPVDVTKCFID